MTFAELRESLEEVKARGPAYGLSEERKRIHFIWLIDYELGLTVQKNSGGHLEVYPTSRGSKTERIGVFPTESDAYAYVHCYFKREWDYARWHGILVGRDNYLKDMLKQLKRRRIPASEYSFEGGMPKDCLCAGQNGEHWEVYYSDGEKKENRGIFSRKKDAYDFLYYLVMKKYVKVKKLWW